MTRFASGARRVVSAARDAAIALEAPSIEAEHLLLGVVRQPATPARRALVDAGLDFEDIRAALDAEFEASLAAVGVSLADFDLAATPAPKRSPAVGTTAKLALERSARIAAGRGDRRLGPSHILLAVLAAPAGTVPRALDRAGIDRVALGDAVAATLGG